MRQLVSIICSFLLVGCSSEATQAQVDTVNCVSAFIWVANRIKGTELQSDPQAAELQVRILYEQEKALRTDTISNVESRVLTTGRKLDQDSAMKLAKGCMIEQEMGDDYRKQRPKLLEMWRALNERQAAQARLDGPR